MISYKDMIPLKSRRHPEGNQFVSGLTLQLLEEFSSRSLLTMNGNESLRFASCRIMWRSCAAAPDPRESASCSRAPSCESSSHGYELVLVCHEQIFFPAPGRHPRSSPDRGRAGSFLRIYKGYRSSPDRGRAGSTRKDSIHRIPYKGFHTRFLLSRYYADAFDFCLEDGRELVLKLADFGLAHGIEDADTHLTQYGHHGTWVYMAPEALHQPGMGGAKKISKQVDVW